MEKRFYRSRKDKKLAGVCGGVAEYFEVDPTLIRLIWVVFTFAGGAGVLAYIIAAIIMPEKPLDISDTPSNRATYEDDSFVEVVEEEDIEEVGETKKQDDQRADYEKSNNDELKEKQTEYRSDSNNVAIGLILVVLGSLFFSRNFLRIHWIDFSYIWPLALILIGVYIIVNQRK
ncbi:PspC domain-containing protein [Tindallia californiensis]|uniref:Phage shock protein C (PspC) family protein n=1 Tax=Tindallia californiensis TaxID=159292 RepID=A0A1H3I4S6_9FIRM|nr:PspC domain-containing protein [Tindallia californiensis]SDY22475.1 phage shock protein C (PspC) family protein [Tindallia californiensis]